MENMLKFFFSTLFLTLIYTSNAHADVLGNIIDCNSRANEVPGNYRSQLVSAAKVVDKFIRKYPAHFKSTCLKKVDFEVGDANDELSAYEFYFADKKSRKVFMEMDVIASNPNRLYIGEFEKLAKRNELSQFFPSDPKLVEQINKIFDADCAKVWDIEISERDLKRDRLFTNPNRNSLVLEYACQLRSGLKVESKITMPVIYKLMK